MSRFDPRPEPQLQLDALAKAGGKVICQEKVSRASARRPELERRLTQLRRGDTAYIYKLDRLGRSLRHLLAVVGDLQQLGMGLVSLTDALNTTSAHDRPVSNLFASLAEFERELIRECTHAGLASARARDRVGSRRRVRPRSELAPGQPIAARVASIECGSKRPPPFSSGARAGGPATTWRF